VVPFLPGCAPWSTHAGGEGAANDAPPAHLLRRNAIAGAREGSAASLLTTARLNGVDPLSWLTDVLERIVSGRTKNHQLHELLPWEWKATRAAQDMKAAA
jgi:hypothetical protein